MNILLTGHRGFIGRNIKERYEKLVTYSGWKDWKIHTPPINLLDNSTLTKYVKANKIDTVVHCAISQDFYQNMQMLINVCKQPVEKIITFGSGCQFNPYPKAPKYKLFKEIQAKMVKGDPRMLNLILYGVYGKYEDVENAFISRSINRLLGGEPIEIYQDRLMDYTYIEAVLSNVDTLLRWDTREQEFLLSSGSHSLIEIAKIIVEEMQSQGRGGAGYIVKEKGRAPPYVCKYIPGMVPWHGSSWSLRRGIRLLADHLIDEYVKLFSPKRS